MRVALLLTAMLALASAHALDHVVISAIGTAGGNLALQHYGVKPAVAAPVAAVTVLVAGVAWEWLGTRKGAKFGKLDVCMDLTGIALALGLARRQR